jgi:hypothetical protein
MANVMGSLPEAFGSRIEQEKQKLPYRSACATKIRSEARENANQRART